MKRASETIALLLVAGALLAGCAPSLPDEPAGITGEVTSFERVDSGDVIATMLVEGGEQPAGAVSDKAQVAIEKGTDIFDADGKPGDIALVSTGAQVKVWFTGPVAESYPVQGAAGAVQVLTPAR